MKKNLKQWIGMKLDDKDIVDMVVNPEKNDENKKDWQKWKWHSWKNFNS